MPRRGWKGVPRKELCRRAAELAGGFDAIELGAATDALLGVMADALMQGEAVTLANFGTFTVRERGARDMPQATGGTKWVPAMKVIYFKPAGSLKRMINGTTKKGP